MRRPLVELRKGGLRIINSALHLDATRRVECGFVSHAHGDHIARHERTIATAATLALMRHRRIDHLAHRQNGRFRRIDDSRERLDAKHP